MSTGGLYTGREENKREKVNVTGFRTKEHCLPEEGLEPS
jgi:hypothetical protein